MLDESFWSRYTIDIKLNNADKPLFQKDLENIEFECGVRLFESGPLDYQAKFSQVTITNQNLDCTSDLEAAYYSKQLGPIRCYKCGMDVSKDKEISDEFDLKKSEFGIVYPSCKDCGHFKCSRPKKKKQAKRRVSFEQKSSAKRPRNLG